MIMTTSHLPSKAHNEDNIQDKEFVDALLLGDSRPVASAEFDIVRQYLPALGAGDRLHVGQ
jgi:hypothetical protein